MTHPLDGVTVVSIEQAVAAPFATRHLADLGARVIKVERKEGGDLARGYDQVVHGTGAHFVWLNRGKESLAVDLKSAEGRDAVRRLIDRADVFVQNLAPGAAARLGLGSEDLRAVRPELITVDMSGFGKGGPMEQRKAYDLLIQAEAGLISLTGTPDTAVKTGIPTADIASGMYCVQAVLSGLLRRYRTGEGSAIDISMLESTVEWLGHALYTQLHTGSAPPRMGLGHSAIAPYDAFPTRDGQVLIGVQSDTAWRTLAADVLCDPELAEDPRFTSNVLRVRNREACDAAIAALTSSLTTAELIDRLSRFRVPAAQMSEISQTIEHPQLAARDRWRVIETENATVKALLPPVTFSHLEARMGPVPALGQHSHELLVESGLTPGAASDLIARGVASKARPRQPHSPSVTPPHTPKEI